MSQTKTKEFERADFMPGDIVRYENGVGVVVDAIVQVGDAPAYGYGWGDGDTIVVRTKGQRERKHIAPDRYQPDDGPSDRFAITEGSADRSKSKVPASAVMEKNPSDCKYNNGEGVTNLPPQDYFDPDIIEMPEYLDRRYYV